MGNSQKLVFKFIKSSGIFLIGAVLSKSIMFLLLPLFTSYIEPAAYGYYDVSITYTTLLVGFLFFDVWTSIMRYMYDCKEVTEKYRIVRSGWSIFGISFLAYSLIATLIIYFTDIKYVGLIFLYGLFQNVSSMYGFISRGFGKNKEFATSGIVCSIITILSNILLLMVFHWDFSALYISFILGSISQVLYLEFHIRMWKNMSNSTIDWILTKSMLIYSLPLCFNSLAYWLITGLNRIAINGIMGQEANGIYAIGAKFGAIISLATTCFTYAWQDLSFSVTAEKGNDGAFYSKACNTYMKFLGAGAAILIPVCYIIFPFMVHSNYAGAKDIVPMVLLVALISALSTFIGNIFYAIKSTRTIFISMVASCLINISLCFPLISYFGIQGANISIFTSFLFNIIIRNFILRKKVSFKLDIKIVLMLTMWIGLSMLIYKVGGIALNLIWFILCVCFMLYLFRDMLMPILKGLNLRRNSEEVGENKEHLLDDISS